MNAPTRATRTRWPSVRSRSTSRNRSGRCVSTSTTDRHAGRTRSDLQPRDARARAAPGHHEGRPRDHLGSEPHDPVRLVRRHVAFPGRAPHRRGLVGPARPLVGHPGSRPLPDVDVAGDPVPRGDVRGLALGVAQRRAHLHRRMLRTGRRRRGDPGDRLPPRSALGRRTRRRGRLRPRRRRRHRCGRPRRHRARRRTHHRHRREKAGGHSGTGRSAEGSTR